MVAVRASPATAAAHFTWCRNHNTHVCTCWHLFTLRRWKRPRSRSQRAQNLERKGTKDTEGRQQQPTGEIGSAYVVGVDVPRHVAVRDQLPVDVAPDLAVPPAAVDVNDADHVPLSERREADGETVRTGKIWGLPLILFNNVGNCDAPNEWSSRSHGESSVSRDTVTRNLSQFQTALEQWTHKMHFLLLAHGASSLLHQYSCGKVVELLLFLVLFSFMGGNLWLNSQQNLIVSHLKK